MTPEQSTLLEEYAAGADKLHGLLDILPTALHDEIPAPGEWSARQIIIHMADSEIVGATRVRQLLAEDNPTLVFYDQGEWAERLGYAESPVGEAVELAVSLRRFTVALLRRAGPEAWQRSATHPTRGPMDLAALLQLYIGHVDGHAAQLKAIVTAADSR